MSRKASCIKTAFDIAWSPLSLARLREIRAYIALDNPAAAERLATRIIALTEALRLQPRLGHRRTTESDVRELVIGGTPYVLFYRLRRKQILITTIHHCTRQK